MLNLNSVIRCETCSLQPNNLLSMYVIVKLLCHCYNCNWSEKLLSFVFTHFFKQFVPCYSTNCSSLFNKSVP